MTDPTVEEVREALDKHDTWIHTLKMTPPPSDDIVAAARLWVDLIDPPKDTK